ncbi:hypothetical protein PG991_003130 [Apiospora marii]|uniref:Uncharacterized protein n=1 Tax=Apiospora marii TaxID=335849 RepID=A0ABR1SHD0_9PEZI
MPTKPIFMVAHPRSCSTAFERMFLTQADQIECIHEPFCDAYHFGPERLSERFEDEGVRAESGYSQSTYQTVLDNIQAASTQGKRTFIKDMAKSLMPPLGKPVADLCPPSLRHLVRMMGGSGISNPTVLPEEILRGYHFTFLIRHPRFSIPSLYKISTPPGSDTTGWHGFHSDDAGYRELRILFDYLKSTRQIGPVVASGTSRPIDQGDCAPEDSYEARPDTSVEICVIDADDLLNEPQKVCRAYCASVGLQFNPSMLSWQSADDQKRAQDAFQKSWAIHVDALSSKSLDPSKNATEMLSVTEENAMWARRFGEDGAQVIRQHVDTNTPHYDYLKQFALKI